MPIRRPVRLSGRRSKYGAVPTVVDNIRFASKREAARYGELKLLEKAGHISGLRLQVDLVLSAPNWRPVTGYASTGDPRVGIYRADFVYRERGADRDVWEDCKGHPTTLYRWKKRHVMAQYGIEIRET